MIATPKIRVLTVSLHDETVGYLVGYQSKNVFTFAHEYAADNNRSTFALTVRTDFPNANKLLAQQWVHHQRLSPLFSNLLPEGGLRSLIAQSLKTHPDNEFDMIGHLGRDLTGAFVIEPASNIFHIQLY